MSCRNSLLDAQTELVRAKRDLDAAFEVLTESLTRQKKAKQALVENEVKLDDIPGHDLDALQSITESLAKGHLERVLELVTEQKKVQKSLEDTWKLKPIVPLPQTLMKTADELRQISDLKVLKWLAHHTASYLALSICVVFDHKLDPSAQDRQDFTRTQCQLEGLSCVAKGDATLVIDNPSRVGDTELLLGGTLCRLYERAQDLLLKTTTDVSVTCIGEIDKDTVQRLEQLGFMITCYENHYVVFM